MAPIWRPALRISRFSVLKRDFRVFTVWYETKVEKWKNQVCCTVEALHTAGVIWGDVKADNVLIDENDDAWVTDFGGGYTEGWVKKESAGSLAGDAEGLTTILKTIGV
ncbi:hypothetical protein BN1708_016006 [Verticillium longisporum]|uniref:Protein kinase domain-containing protein n=1 Tax=Verticillium longisporum TaxID=100787 RepID=A0A0G4MBX2_VERLO|nr:hypothetical protein BN1708_016006 [Verticillium longisporum]